MSSEAGSGFITDTLGQGSFYATPGLYDLIPQVTPPGANYFPVTVIVPVNPLDAGSGGGAVDSVVPGTNVTVDDTDPANPVVSSTSEVIDMGTITVSVDILDDANLDLDAEVAPYSKSQTPANLVAHAPEYATDFLPLTALLPGGQLVVSYLCTLLGDLWDEVNLVGSIVVWDQAGQNLLSASFSFDNIVAGDELLELSQVQLIGTDLSIGDEGQSVQSAAGGSYNIRLKANASWS